MVFLCLLAALFFALLLFDTPQPFAGSVATAVALLVLGIAAERVEIDLYGRGRIIPTASIIVAGAFLLGPAGAALLGGVVTFLGVSWNAPWRRRLFNTASALIISGLLGGAAGPLGSLIDAIKPLIDAYTLPLGLDAKMLFALPVGLVLGGTLFIGNVTMLTLVMAISEGLPPVQVYRERLAWLVPHTLAYGVIGTGMALAADQLGPLSLFLFAVPVFLLRQVSAQIIESTRAQMDALNATRDSLQEAYTTVQEREALLEDMVVDLQRAHDETIGAFSAMLDARDRETEGHSERVVGYAMALARALAVPEESLPALSLGARLHDIGKVAIPDAILLKPGPLSAEEWVIMRQHPQIGTRLVQGKPNLQIAIPVIRHHHERFDGTGYPDQLAGEAIPLAARIFAVSDVFDALVSDRPYRSGMSIEKAARIINEGSGTQFDPHVVTAFNMLIASGELNPPYHAAPITAGTVNDDPPDSTAVILPLGTPVALAMLGALLPPVGGGRHSR